MTVIVINAPEYPIYREDAYKLEADGYKFEEHTFPNVYDVPDPNNPTDRVKYSGFFCAVDFSSPTGPGKLYRAEIDEYRFYPEINAWSVDGITPGPAVIGGLYMRVYGTGGDPNR